MTEKSKQTKQDNIYSFMDQIGIRFNQDNEIGLSNDKQDKNLLKQHLTPQVGYRCTVSNSLIKYTYVPNDDLPSFRSSLLFPQKREVYEKVKDEEQINVLLTGQLTRRKLALQVKVVENDAKYNKSIIVVCYSCGKKLLMKYQTRKNLEEFKLAYFDNTHIHGSEIEIFHGKQLKWKSLLVELKKYGKDIKNINIQQLYQHLSKKYKLTKRAFHNFIWQLRQQRQKLGGVLFKFLSKQKSRNWVINDITNQDINTNRQMSIQSPESYYSDPDFLMFSFPYMAENQKQYGRICFISILSGYVQLKTSTRIKTWEVISFAGLNSSNYFAPFAIALLESTCKSQQILTAILNKFLKEFSILPQVIITPAEDDILSKTVQELKLNGWKGIHLFDPLCYLDIVGSQIDNINDRIYYQQIILSKDRHEFQKNCQQLFRKVHPTVRNIKAFNKLLKYAPKMCFSQIETDKFIGIPFIYSANRLFLYIIKQVFTKPKLERVQQNDTITIQSTLVRKRCYRNNPTFVKATYQIAKAVLRYNKFLSSEVAKRFGYCQWACEEYIEWPQITAIRANIKKVYMNLLFVQFGKMLRFDVTQRPLKDTSCPQMRIFDVYDKETCSVFTVSPRPEYGENQELERILWRCTCLYSFKCGLPCAHQLKIILRTFSSVHDQIHPLWKKERYIPPGVRRRGRSKGTRRNTEK